MSQAAFMGGFQVTLTGRCLEPQAEATLRGRLQQQFQLSEAQAARMLAGHCVVKHSLPLEDAARLAGRFRRCGLEAKVEAMPGTAAKPPTPQTRPVSAALPPPEPSPVLALQALPRGGMTAAEPLERRERLRLLRVSATALLLPLLYVVPVVVLALQWAWTVAHLHTAGTGLALLLASYLFLGLGGALLLLLLFKPLLAPRPPAQVTLPLDPAEEAEFVRGVEALCAAVGVPPPAEIRFDGGVNASLDFGDGWRGWLRNQRVLRLGLPLFAGLSAREFAGVLAYGLGHGAATARLRSFVLINRINAWLEERALRPDAWDERLERWHEASQQPLVQTATSLAALGIGFTQLVLGTLSRLGHALTQPLLQDLVATADHYEALVAGSQQFRLTARNRRALAQAAEEVQETNTQTRHEGRLLKDLPEAIGAEFRAMDGERLQAIEQEMELPLTRYWEAHPADVERVRGAEAQAAQGLLVNDQPASRLLQQPERWNQELTQLVYRAQGLDYRPEQLQAREALLAPAAPRDAARNTIDRFFNAQYRPWPLLRLKVAASPALAALGWQGVIDSLRQRSPELTQDWTAADELEQRRPRLLLAAALKLKPSQFGLKDLDSLSPEDLWRQLERIRNRDTEVHRHLQEDLALHAFRIDCAIHALADQARSRAEALRALLVALQRLEAPAAVLVELQGSAETLQRIAAAGGHPDAEKDLAEVQRQFAEQAGRLLQAGAKLPQRFAEGGSVGGYLLARCPEAGPERAGDRAQYLRDARGLAEAFQQFYRLCLAELIALCEEAERRHGITPIRRL